ncbi:MAG: hypothetical protein C0631_04940 [Sedimenticola sp.]|nr:MAG: hypothetical protein C0631_04940 [Sedimenticola sp.]
MGKKGVFYLLLLALAISLGLAVWLSPEKLEQPTTQPLTGLSPDQVTHIRISNNNGPAFTLERDGDTWQMTQPYRIEANTPRIDILLDFVATPSFERFPAPRERLAEFGLDKPKAVMQFNSSELIFGGTHPYNYRRYVQIGETIHLTNDNFPHHFLAKAEDFVSHSLLPKEQSILSIRTADWQMEKSNGRWLLMPEVPGISADDLVRKAGDWEKTWVSDVINGSGLTVEQQIEIWLKGSDQPILFGLVRRDQSLLLVRQDNLLAYQLPGDTDLADAPSPGNKTQ